MIGQNLKLLRKQFVKSQDEVSKALDLNRSTYSGYENAVAQPSIDIITKSAIITYSYGCSFEK